MAQMTEQFEKEHFKIEQMLKGKNDKRNETKKTFLCVSEKKESCRFSANKIKKPLFFFIYISTLR